MPISVNCTVETCTVTSSPPELCSVKAFLAEPPCGTIFAKFRYSTDGGQTWNDNGGLGFDAVSGTGTEMEDGVSIAFSDGGTLTVGDRFSIDTFVPTIQVAQDAFVTLGDASNGGAPITIRS